MTHPVVAEAIKKAAVVWVSVAGGPAYALWCMPHDGSLYVVAGPGEQTAPDLAGATEATLTLRGDHGGRIVDCPATVRPLTPGTEEWDTVTPQLAAKRLNASGTAETLVARWQADGCLVAALTPADGAGTTGRDLPDDAAAEPPRETPARVPARRPFRLHRVRRRK
ncbi:hypothetical protein [Spirilliplanes yamanashiensis]|uniref:Uncharacterized protein n=1 Tax=Spirilliplanes yamanashiensis TaxID=42233 RepID=A0A8J3Y321_9ACTN|nr:hypothetical protein [Spirilliplanes yamanashiensis]MDP9814276.1 hypothetical protein [Spirilliplanes yamanashiensis]GIJ00741.1 hypothetical protein Sya03_00930 [Spirilliplanes yamanashiensis]